jgi:hypothetical protein
VDARQLRLPLYSESQGAPIAILRVELATTEFERRGFFRVGLFPRAIFTGVALELESQDHLSESLRGLAGLLERTRKGQPWELRLVRVTFRNSTAGDLALGRITQDGASAWRFESLSQAQADGPPRTVTSGRLLAGAGLQLETPQGSMPLADWLAGRSETQATRKP